MMRNAPGPIIVRPVVVPWLPDVGTVVAYLLRERVTDVAQPVGNLVVVEQDDGADPRALTEVPAEPHVQPLTPCELEVLRLLALGSEHEYIAAELEVTLHTVRSHVANLRWKLNAKSRFEAVMTATRLGILSFDDRKDQPLRGSSAAPGAVLVVRCGAGGGRPAGSAAGNPEDFHGCCRSGCS